MPKKTFHEEAPLRNVYEALSMRIDLHVIAARLGFYFILVLQQKHLRIQAASIDESITGIDVRVLPTVTTRISVTDYAYFR